MTVRDGEDESGSRLFTYKQESFSLLARVTINSEIYMGLLPKLGAKTIGLLTSLALAAQLDSTTGCLFVEGSQEEIGRIFSGGDTGWSPTPTREVLEGLTSRGLLEKVPGKALGRNRGSSPPRWIIPSSLCSVTPGLLMPQRMEAHSVTPPKIEAPMVEDSKINASQIAPLPSSKKPQNLAVPKVAASHEMNDEYFIHTCNDDNTSQPELLSLAVTRALARMGWVDASSAVARFGVRPLAAWILASAGRNNPGGWVRAQTKKPEWPHYPSGFDSDTFLTVSDDGTIKASPRRGDTSPSPAQSLMTLEEIHQVLAGSGEIGVEIRRRWLSEVDGCMKDTPDNRSHRLREIGTQLIYRYGLTNKGRENKSA